MIQSLIGENWGYFAKSFLNDESVSFTTFVRYLNGALGGLNG